MLKIKLSRYGRKKLPFYRVVVQEARAKRDGKYIDLIGTYNPLTNPVTLSIDHEKARGWIAKGVQPTETVAYLLRKENFTYQKGVDVVIPQRRKKTKRDRKREEEAKKNAEEGKVSQE